jgi:hypothetical protein
LRSESGLGEFRSFNSGCILIAATAGSSDGRTLCGLDSLNLRLAAPRQQRRGDDRELVYVERHPQADIDGERSS